MINTKFNTGDKVIHSIHGSGTVIFYHSDNSVEVKFDRLSYKHAVSERVSSDCLTIDNEFPYDENFPSEEDLQ